MTEQVDTPLDELLTRDDYETVDVGQITLGGPVDLPHQREGVYATIVNQAEQPRKPIVDAWLRNPEQRRTVAKIAVGAAAHHTAYHATRTPKYLLKVALYAPIGLLRGLWIVAKWVFDPHAEVMRQHAANTKKHDEFRVASGIQDQHISRRGRTVLFAAIVLLIGVLVAWATLPHWWLYTAAGLLSMPLAWLGRPKDKPITDRVTIGEKFTRLTAQQVRDALVSLGIARIKDPGDLTFPVPVHRDGPGWLARVNLPNGVEVTDVLERRGRLSSALRLPVDQVWPTSGPDHAGQLDLWVGYVPASRMGQPHWSLADKHAQTSVFKVEEFASDQRQRPVKVRLFENNFLIGGRPGSGKSFGARTLATIAALDPTAEMKILEYKGTGDFLDFAPLCSTYVCGLSDYDFQTGLGVLTWGLAEAERRGQRILRAYERGEAPERKVTPELASRPNSGLHPVVIVIDEAHELFGDPDVGKEAASAAIRLAKRGRALGIILVIATQIPDKDSLPPQLTRVIGIRWCMAVPDQIANDQILGTGAYKRGLTGTVYRPQLDAGWGVLFGLAESGSARSQFPSPQVVESILKRATQLRGGVIGSDVEVAEGRDFLDDMRRIFVGEVFVSWQAIAARLSEQMPEYYAGITAESVSALARGYGLESRDGKERGSARTLKGLRLEHLTEGIRRREIGAAQ